ncbi:ABC transporter related protein [Thermocrinis albus DSM 14484]|uniref:ABC transporter related protein n=2 Tax=Thermocrinis TaxID=75905 RepID=D3SQB3_THEAH|nr:ABC transporter related protein [Thermocrinis albus DSM 14484]
MRALLEVRNVTVKYGNFTALDRVSLSISQGELRVLIGPNGAGKTTLLDAISGTVKPSYGDIYYKNTVISKLPIHKIARMGIIRKFQTPNVIESLSVWDNLILASVKKNVSGTFAPVDHNKIKDILELVGLHERRYDLAKELSHGEKQWLELAMILTNDCDLVLLDEPAIGLTLKDIYKLIDIIGYFIKRNSSIIIVDHNMDFLRMICEKFEARVTFMHQGKILRTGTFDEIRSDNEVKRIYLGVERC